MPKILPFPEPVPYAGQVSLHVEAQSLGGLWFPNIDTVSMFFEPEGGPSNVAPHIIKRLSRIGIAQSEVAVTTVATPHPQLQSVTKTELVNNAINAGAGKRMWAALGKAVTSKQECGLVLAEEGNAESIKGDFGFGLAWLAINYTTLTGPFIAHNVLANRAEELGLARS